MRRKRRSTSCPLPGGDHSLAYRDGKPARLVATTALAFFDLHLKNRDEARHALEEAPGIEAVP
jgi:hypothetical protein